MPESDSSTKASAKKLVRRIEEEIASASARLGEKMLENNELPSLKKCVLWYLGQHFDIHAMWYLSVIKTYEQIDTTYSNLLVEVAQDTLGGTEKLKSHWPNLEYVTFDPEEIAILLRSKYNHWKSVALKKIREAEESQVATVKNTKAARRGYHKEVRDWMDRKEITSVKAASIRLFVSVSVLNSIMADHGKIKYSADTLNAVLSKIIPAKPKNK